MRNLGILTDEERAEFVSALDELADSGGGEEGHSSGDDILIAVLRKLGENEIADAWVAIPDKWYA